MIPEERLGQLSNLESSHGPTKAELRELVIAYRFFTQTRDLMQRNLEFYELSDDVPFRMARAP